VNDCFVCRGQEWPHAAAVETTFGRGFFETMSWACVCSLLGYGVTWCIETCAVINVATEIIVSVFCQAILDVYDFGIGTVVGE
jgi:hypothetical protein